MARIEGGQWGFGHPRIGIFEKLVTLENLKNSLYRAIFSTFLDILCISMHFRAIKSSILTKMDEFLLNHPNFLKISAPAAPKMGHFSQFFGAFGTEKLVTFSLKCPPFRPLTPLLSIPDANDDRKSLENTVIAKINN